MLEELTVVLEGLSAALSELKNVTKKYQVAQEEIGIQKNKQNELQHILDDKAKTLDAREAEIKEIESISEFSKQAKKLMAEAKELMQNAEQRQAVLEEGLKKLGEDRIKLTAEVEEKAKYLKSQADALKKERKELEDKIKAYKAVSAAL
jgi:DNA repair ATPase RecN